MKRLLIMGATGILAVALLAAAGSYSASLYYSAGHGTACADCHEMAGRVDAIHSSPHRDINCTDCHDASPATKLRHIRVHLSGNAPEQIHLRLVDADAMVANCRKCHQEEYANWHAGPHSATYSDILTNSAHNTKRRLMDDCLRCHGMYFDGGIRRIVQPQNLKGPWHIIEPALASQPTMPCLACHWIHRSGAPQTKPPERISVTGPAVRPSLGFFDRREQLHFAATDLPLPQLYDGATLLKTSTDARQAVCYQCHAPREPEATSAAAVHRWGMQAGSGDDRTPMGVHEGLSCFSCHSGHNEDARASCVTCHAKMSNCGQDVEKMDTTYANPKSPHNIHWVKCTDCHQHGIPEAKHAARPA